MQGVRQKSTAGVSGIRRGHFFAVRRSRCPHICRREVINMLVAEYKAEAYQVYVEHLFSAYILQRGIPH